MVAYIHLDDFLVLNQQRERDAVSQVDGRDGFDMHNKCAHNKVNYR